MREYWYAVYLQARVWWTVPGLNRSPFECHSNALPNELTARDLELYYLFFLSAILLLKRFSVNPPSLMNFSSKDLICLDNKNKAR